MTKKKYDPRELTYDSTKDYVYSDQFPDAWMNHTTEDYDRAIQEAQRILEAYQEKGRDFQIARTERMIQDLVERKDRLNGRLSDTGDSA